MRPPPLTQWPALMLKSALLLAALMSVSYYSGVSAMAAPFSASCVLLVLLPLSPFSAPRSVLLSHLLCLAAGLLFLTLNLWLPLPPLLLALGATWLGLLMMAWLRAVHAPALAHAVILCLGQQQVGTYLMSALLLASGYALFAWLQVRRNTSITASA